MKKEYSIPLWIGENITVHHTKSSGDSMIPETIKTDEVTLRPLYNSDPSSLETIEDKADRESVIEYINWNPDSSRSLSKFVEESSHLWNESDQYMYEISDTSTGEIVGVVACNVDRPIQKADIGIWTYKSEIEETYASTVFTILSAICFEFLNLSIVKGKADFSYQESVVSLQRSILGLGGSFEGIIRNHSKVRDDSDEEFIRDVVVYSIHKDEFYTLRHKPKELEEFIDRESLQTNSVSLTL